MDAIGRIAATAAATAGQGDLVPGLGLGRAVQARVQQMLGEGLYRLMTPAGPMQLETTTPLPVGATVTLTLAQTDDGPQIRLAVQSGPAAPDAVVPAPPRGAVRPVETQSRMPVPAQPGQGASFPRSIGAPAELRLPPPAPIGSSLRPVADLPSTAARTLATVPATMPSAAPTIAPPAVHAGAVTPALAKEAAAETAQVGRAGETTAPVARTPVAQAISAALKVQDGLAPLLAGLVRTAARGPAREAGIALTTLQRLEALAFPLALAPDGEDLREALARAGPLLESRFAAASPLGPRGDLKALLLTLRDAWPGPPRTTGIDDVAPTVRQPPPRPGAPPAPPSMAVAAGDAAAEPALGDLVRAALARMTLQQAASLPSPGESGPIERAGAPFHATVPIALSSGLTLAEIIVEPEPKAPASIDGPERTWRVWVALDAEPHGRVTALVTYRRERGVGVTLWAERPDAAQALVGELGALRASLIAGDLTVDDLAARAGSPSDRAGAGLKLDRLS